MLRQSKFNRRGFVFGSAGLALAAWEGAALAKQVVKRIADLAPGEFTWHPERSPEGLVAIIVSIPDQLVHVYRNGIRIAVSTCSTGKKGHETPSGVFTILQKDKDHRSSTYNNAPMPNMNRLTWDGIALHAGKLPGYPASHGCVRLPMEFSEKLFGITHLGTPVILADGHTVPTEVAHSGLVLGDYAEHEFDKALSLLEPSRAPQDTGNHVAILVSSANKQIIVLQNGKSILEMPARIQSYGASETLGENVFILKDTHDAKKGLAWTAISYAHASELVHDTPEDDLLTRISADTSLAGKLHNLLHPGATLVTTDLPLHPSMQSDDDFVIMTA